MFVYLKFFVLFVCFNHCCGASNLIPTAIYSPQIQNDRRHPQNGQHINVGHLNSEASPYYPIYSLPLGANQGLQGVEGLQFSGSLPQPAIDMSRGSAMAKNIANYQLFVQKHAEALSHSNVPQPVQNIQTPNLAQGEPMKLAKIRYYPANRSSHRIPQSRSVSTQLEPKANLSVNQKPQIPMLLRSQTSARTPMTQMTPTHQNSILLKSNVRNLESNRGPKSDLNSTALPRVHSITFNWPKSKPMSLQNSAENQQIFLKDVPTFQPQTTPLPTIQSNQPNSEVSKRQFYGESKPYFRYDPIQPSQPSTAIAETTPTPTTVTELYRKSTTTLSSQTIDHSTVMATEPLREESLNKSEKMSSVDSELNYQTQFYDSHKLLNDNYELKDEPDSYHIPQYGMPVNENTGIAIPENEVNYAQPQPEPETSEPYVENYGKESYDEPNDNSNGAELKSLLEQFIQQLDILKMVAAKELQKSHGTYSSGIDGKAIHQTVGEPSVSKSGVTYGEYQNERSYEQNLSNTQTNSYKDTNERSGRKYPCKKPFHPGALPHHEHHHY